MGKYINDNEANIENQILSLSKVLMAVPSVIHDKKSMELALAIANQELEEFTSEQFINNGITSLIYYKNAESYKTPFRIILNANLDVAPGTKEQFQPREQDGKLYGRGAIVKSSASALIMAFKTAAKTVSYPIALQIITDLQSAGLSIKHQIEKGVRGDFFLAFSSTKFQVSNESKGTLWIRVKSKGSKAPGAHPYLGQNAVKLMIDFINSLYKKYPQPTAGEWVTTVNVSKLETSHEMVNITPDNCTALLDIRYIPAEHTSIIESIKKLLPSNFEMEVIIQAPPMYTPPDNAFIKLLSKKYIEVTGSTPKLVKNSFANAAQYFSETGSKCVCFGVMGEGNYTDNEWADITSTNQYYKIMKEFLLAAEKLPK